ncbi:hypothetical protein [Actinoplanes sp. NPDC026670]|uniref:hypothetical protein n=1 Tax=Actinoplanes sp. NPDC026670 TaxID=3154700 RepID=UPI0033D9F999
MIFLFETSPNRDLVELHERRCARNQQDRGWEPEGGKQAEGDEEAEGRKDAEGRDEAEGDGKRQGDGNSEVTETAR